MFFFIFKNPSRKILIIYSHSNLTENLLALKFSNIFVSFKNEFQPVSFPNSDPFDEQHPVGVETENGIHEVVLAERLAGLVLGELLQVDPLGIRAHQGGKHRGPLQANIIVLFKRQIQFLDKISKNALTKFQLLSEEKIKSKMIGKSFVVVDIFDLDIELDDVLWSSLVDARIGQTMDDEGCIFILVDQAEKEALVEIAIISLKCIFSSKFNEVLLTAECVF